MAADKGSAMGYQVLARKWRPSTFDEVVGQQHVLTALGNALDQGRLHHAYLLSGTRGVGKTTIARILAKCLNCEAGVSSHPCGKCNSCIEIEQGNFVDLLEIDAASRTKVEDTRELLDNVQYRPARGRFKVYLIDEVHMLSRHSFNALLKTLEEPPPHVKFLLATTDPQKLPITVLSRCLQFHLKSLTREQIVEQLARILTAEKQPFESQALPLLAKAADGSMRDALSLTDQALGYGNGEVCLDSVQAMLGTLDQRHLHQLLQLLVAGQGAPLMAKVEELCELGPDFEQVHGELASLLHRVALAQWLGSSVDPQAFDANEVQQLAGLISPEEVQLYYQIALTGRKELPFAPDGRAGLEMTLLRMLAFAPRTEMVARPAPSAPVSPSGPSSVAFIAEQPLATAKVKAPLVQPSKEIAPSESVSGEEQENAMLAAEQASLMEQAEQMRANPVQPQPRTEPQAASEGESRGISHLLHIRNRLRSRETGENRTQDTVTDKSAAAPGVMNQAAPSALPHEAEVPSSRQEADSKQIRVESGNPQDPPPWDVPPLEAYQDSWSPEPESTVDLGVLQGKADSDRVMAATLKPTEPTVPDQPSGLQGGDKVYGDGVPVAVSSSTRLSIADDTDGCWRSDDLLRDCGDDWGELIAATGIRGRLRQLALHSVLEREGDNWHLSLRPEQRHLLSERAVEELSSRLSAHLDKPVTVKVAAQSSTRMTPAELEAARYQQLLVQARQVLAQDPNIQFLMERFGAELDVDTIQPLKP